MVFLLLGRYRDGLEFNNNNNNNKVDSIAVVTRVYNIPEIFMAPE